MAKSAQSGPSLGCMRVGFRGLQVFGALLLLLAALFAVGPAIHWRDALRMRNWEPTPATVLSAELIAEDADSGHAEATYRYEYQGVAHEGHRIDVADRIVTSLPEQQRIVAELKRLRNLGQPMTCYVNPADPSESVVYPQISYASLALSLLPAALLGLFGSISFFAPTRALRKLREHVAIKQNFPNEPWMWRDDWAAGRIRTDSYDFAWVLVVMAVLYLFVALPIAFYVLTQNDWSVLSWPGIILMLIGWAALSGTRQMLKVSRKWKHAHFRLGAPHGLIGGPLAGVVEIPTSTPPDTAFHVRLECQEASTGTDDRTGRVTLWDDETTVQPTSSSSDSGNTVLPIYFAIPYSCKPTDPDYLSTVRWKLTVETGSPASCSAAFEVPVFQSADSSPDYKADRSILAPYQPAGDVQQTLAKVCRMRTLPGGDEELRFSYFDRTVLIVVAVFVAMLLGGIIALFQYGAHPGWALLPGGLALILTLATGAMVLWGSRLKIGRSQITIESGLAGFRKRRTLPRDQVAARVSLRPAEENIRETKDSWCIYFRIGPPVDPAKASIAADDDRVDEESLDDDKLNDELDDDKLDDDGLDDHELDDHELEDEDLDDDSEDDDSEDDESALLPWERGEALILVKRLDSQREAEHLADWLREKLGLTGAAVSDSVS